MKYKNKIEKELCNKSNQIVKQLERFVKEKFNPNLKGIDNFPELTELFLIGAWYGAYKALQTESITKIKRR